MAPVVFESLSDKSGRISSLKYCVIPRIHTHPIDIPQRVALEEAPEVDGAHAGAVVDE